MDIVLLNEQPEDDRIGNRHDLGGPGDRGERFHPPNSALGCLRPIHTVDCLAEPFGASGAAERQWRIGTNRLFEEADRFAESKI